MKTQRDVDPQKRRLSANHVPRERLERIDLPPVEARRCNYCGAQVPRGSKYCGQPCSSAYDSLKARQGKSVIDMLKIWRRYRGAKNSPAAGMLNKLAARTDEILREDRDRIKSLSPEAGRTKTDG